MHEEERKNTLLITLSNIGDVILTTPVIASLRSLFPRGKLTVVVGPKAAGLLKGSRLIDELLIYDKQAGPADKLKLVRKLREEFYEWVVDLRNSAFPFLVRANHRSSVFRSYRSRGARERHLEILRMTGLQKRLRNAIVPSFDFFSPADEKSLAEKLKAKGLDLAGDWVVVAPGAGSEQKRWKIEGFLEVARRILESADFKIAAVGDGNEAALCARLSEGFPSRIVSLAGAIGLRELGALISRARLVLTNDSAVMHLGYELRRPVAALFGPTDHQKYGRENEIWRIVREDSPQRFQAMSPEKVAQACEELLNGTAREIPTR